LESIQVTLADGEQEEQTVDHGIQSQLSVRPILLNNIKDITNDPYFNPAKDDLLVLVRYFNQVKDSLSGLVAV
jgi:hypothetical protein